MVGDSRSKGHEFEFQCRILDGHDILSPLIVVKIIMWFEKKIINKKEAGVGPFF